MIRKINRYLLLPLLIAILFSNCKALHSVGDFASDLINSPSYSSSTTSSSNKAENKEKELKVGISKWDLSSILGSDYKYISSKPTKKGNEETYIYHVGVYDYTVNIILYKVVSWSKESRLKMGTAKSDVIKIFDTKNYKTIVEEKIADAKMEVIRFYTSSYNYTIKFVDDKLVEWRETPNLKKGMSKDDIIEKLGADYKLVSVNESTEGKKEKFYFRTNFYNYTIDFVDDKLVEWSQEIVPQIGMHKNEVIQELGTDYRIVSERQTPKGQIEVLSFRTKDHSYTLHFLNGMLIEWKE